MCQAQFKRGLPETKQKSIDSTWQANMPLELLQVLLALNVMLLTVETGYI